VPWADENDGTVRQIDQVTPRDDFADGRGLENRRTQRRDRAASPAAERGHVCVRTLRGNGSLHWTTLLEGLVQLQRRGCVAHPLLGVRG